jgi:hypothetical protein
MMREESTDTTPPHAGRVRRLLAALLVTVWGAFQVEAAELSREVAALYSSVSIYPPSANSMTVCYGFVCRRREILDFSPGDQR